MSSITYWHRLEPRPRSEHDILPSLAARVRDPLWMLTRQWQMGELQGEDAASPAWMRTSTRTAPFTGWRIEGQPTQPLTGEIPLEDLVETEAFGEDLALRVEIGQTAESLLRLHGVLEPEIAQVRAAFAVPERAEEQIAADPDRDAARFERVVMGRALDGLALYRAAASAAPNLPPELAGIAGAAAVLAALDELRAWVEEIYGAIGPADAGAWRPERLEYGVEVLAETPEGGSAVLSCDPDRDGGFDWYTFDVKQIAAGAGGNSVPASATQSVLPTHVRFRGMPNQRWWDFEEGSTDFGAVEPEKRDLAKLLVMDFMLIHGNDWYLLPLRQPVGQLLEIEWLVVHDVFGDVTHIPRADAAPVPAADRWTLFSLTAPGQPNGIAPFLIQPPTAAGSVLEGPMLEEVRFLRDEMANMVWAIEEILEGGSGQPLRGLERSQASKPAEPPAPAPAPPGPPLPAAVPLKYQIQTEVPENWIPFLPVLIDPVNGDVALQIAAMLRTPPGQPPEPVFPRGRILNPTGLGGAEYQIREEEVSRAGTRVNRLVRRSRWTDGSTHLWISRRRTPGAGEGSSGLKYDLAKVNR
ncbi:MAG TPA: hypothetical protein VLV54_08160 [Thermoanaerobaculia bacterium]|nr:hypothetical protein [Thermoanaerobaculia bacterium]